MAKQPSPHPRPSFGPALDPERLTREELRRLAKATRRLASADPDQSDSGRREMQHIEHRRLQRVESLTLAARLAETSALARARGEEVRSETVRIATPLVDEHGVSILRRGLPTYRTETVTRVRVASRGGLQLAFERGDLDGGPVKAERLLDTGRTYRWAYEASVALTTPQRPMSPVSARAAFRTSNGPQEQVFRAGELLRSFRAGLGERQVAVLDRVCGRDLTVRAAALSLRCDPRSARKALIDGLTLAETNRRLARQTAEVTEGAT